MRYQLLCREDNMYMYINVTYTQEMNIPRNEIKVEVTAKVIGQQLDTSFVFSLVLVSVKIQNP